MTEEGNLRLMRPPSDWFHAAFIGVPPSCCLAQIGRVAGPCRGDWLERLGRHRSMRPELGAGMRVADIMEPAARPDSIDRGGMT
jgi:hypothetical protein